MSALLEKSKTFQSGCHGSSFKILIKPVEKQNPYSTEMLAVENTSLITLTSSELSEKLF